METIKAEWYLTYLDRILAGEDIEPIENSEVASLIRLSQALLAVDFSDRSKIREQLLHQNLGKLPPPEQAVPDVMGSKAGKEEIELTEEELSLVTAAGQKTAHSCFRCGRTMSWLQRECPFCRE